MSNNETSLVHAQWAKVMSGLLGIGKNERAQAGRTSFSFRGVDSTVNAIGPLLREHKVMVIPRVIDVIRDEHESKSGGRMVGTVVNVEYSVYAEDGSYFRGSAYGEASDAGDKSVPKAMSVAFRTFLLQATAAPTDEPDPDTQIYERGSSQPEPRPNEPAMLNETAEQISDLFTQFGFTPEQQASGIAANARRRTTFADLTEPEAQRVLLALQRKAQAQAAAPTPEQAEAQVQRALGAEVVERTSDPQAAQEVV